MDKPLRTYEEFWPFYVSQHLNATCRRLHFIGTSLSMLAVVAAVALSPAWLLAAPLAGYGFAWAGHYGFEKNRPATFAYPLWSLRADFRMWRYIALGRMGSELAKGAAFKA
jgi:hypothetical protein